MLSRVIGRNDLIAVSYGPVYKPMSNARNVLRNRFQLAVVHTNGYTEVETLYVSRNTHCDEACFSGLWPLLTWHTAYETVRLF